MDELTERQRYWLDHIQACEDAGKTIAEYAAEHGLAAQAMYAGKKKLVIKGALATDKPAQFQRVHVSKPLVGCEWHIQMPNGVSVRFSGTVDAMALKTLLSTVATLG